MHVHAWIIEFAIKYKCRDCNYSSDTYVRSSSISLLLEESVNRPMAIELKSQEDILEWLQESGFSESVIESLKVLMQYYSFSLC